MIKEHIELGDFRAACDEVFDRMAAYNLRPLQICHLFDRLPMSFFRRPHNILKPADFTRVRDGVKVFDRYQLENLAELLDICELIQQKAGNIRLDWEDTNFWIERVKSARGFKNREQDSPTPEDWAIFSRICTGEDPAIIASELGMTLGCFSAKLALIEAKFDGVLADLFRIRKDCEKFWSDATLVNRGLSSGVSQRPSLEQK